MEPGAAPVQRVCAPKEVWAQAPRKTDDYLAFRAANDLRAPYRIDPQFLKGTKPDAEFDTSDAPLIVFINTRSGGRVGPQLAGVLARAVGTAQVYDVSEYRPDKVLGQIWANLLQQEQQGNPRAAHVRSRLRILACGGDGTVAWILKVIQQLGLQPHPAVAIMPLGTGNDLSRSLHWGPEFEHGWIKGHASVYSTLKRVADARVSDLDSWRLRLLLPNSSFKPAKTYAMTEVEQQQHLDVTPKPGCAGEAHSVLMEGMFWNYFSVGADAQAAYSFHHLRDQHPVLASNRVANQFWYSTFSCTSGWFCGSIPSVSSFSRVEVLQPGSSSWRTLAVPPSIKALVLVNLQSYGGGRNIWGQQPSKQQGRWRQPSFSDGLIEVVGFHSGYHAMSVMATGAKLANGKRLAQVCGIRLALQDSVVRPDGEPGQVFMQLDGEPWVQKVPPGNASAHIVLEVVHAGISKVLCNATDPDPEPESKMVGLLGKQQAAAYLTASAELDAGEASLEHPHQYLQQLEAHAAVGQQPATVVELLSAARPGSAAHHLLQPPSRVAYTDGGVVPCSDVEDSTGIAAAASAAVLMRHSVDVQPGASPAGCSSNSRLSSTGVATPGTPCSAATGSTSSELPSAVAVIEARCADGKKVALGAAGMHLQVPGGAKGVRPKQMPPPAFVQLAGQMQAKQC